VLIQTIRYVLGRGPLEIPGLEDDPFITSEVENLKLLTAGKVTALYDFFMGGQRYAVKTLTSIHHKDTLKSIREKNAVLERLGFPKVHSINDENNFYIMDYLRGESVFDKVIRAGRRRHVRNQMDLATLAFLSTVSQIHANGWLLNDLSWRNFMFTDYRVRPVDLDRIRTVPEEAEYIAGLGGKASYTTPLFLSVAQCLNSVPCIEDEMQGIALMIDCIYNGDYLVGAYLEAHGLEYSRRNQALMLVSGFYPEKRQLNLPERLREPIQKIIVKHDTSVTAQQLLEIFR
jgi:hypothetical protein